MKYNPKGMIRGALTATAGLAVLASTACQTARVTNWALDLDAAYTGPTMSAEGRLTKPATVVPGNPNQLQLNLIDKRGSNSLFSVNYSKPFDTYSVETVIQPWLTKGTPIKLDYKGTVPTNRIDMSQFKKIRVEVR
jgi:hypothetical protein